MFRLLRFLSQFLLAWVFLHCLWLVADGRKAFDTEADVAIVLGNTVFEDGSLSPWLKGRVDAALHLYRNGQVKKIFVSGGIGPSFFPEGDGMRNYLLSAGVPDSVIVVDNEGDNSYLTAKNFLHWNEGEHYHSAVVVSSYYHITRSKYIVKKLGFKEVGGAYSSFETWADWYGMAREFPAFYKYLLLY